MKEILKQRLPVIAGVLAAVYFGVCMWPVSDRSDDFHYHKFGHIPVIGDGRFKPISTVAQMDLLILTHRQQLYDEDAKQTYPATKWLLDCLTTPLPNDRLFNELMPEGAAKGVAFQYKIFRIESDQVRDLLKLDKKRASMRFSVVDIAPEYSRLVKEARRVLGDEDHGIPAIAPKDYTLFDAKIAELWQHLNLFLKLCGHAAPLTVPSADGSDQWRPFREAHLEFGPHFEQMHGDAADLRSYSALRQMLKAYESGHKSEFNNTLAKYLSELERQDPARVAKIKTEVFFNDFAPFWRCFLLYGFIALIGAISWLDTNWSQSLRRAAFVAMAVTFVVHTGGLFLRMYLQDRMFVFVTNLYSSAIFIGWGCVVVCMIAEWLYGNGIAIVVGAATGFCTLFIADRLSLDGDTMVMMQAVLDTNFWLATHVTCVTLGYTAAFVAGGMGLAYIFLGIFTNMLRKNGSADLARMTYGVLCAGMFLSFVGTVLGGLWADYSWGRFWGWDPKENGALLIVIWIALILHARWGGMVKHRGIAVLSVLGIIITSWSWFGTNFLGVGLHAYGGAKGTAMMMLVLIDFGFLAIAGLGAFLPLHLWQSFSPPSTSPPQGALLKPTR